MWGCVFSLCRRSHATRPKSVSTTLTLLVKYYGCFYGFVSCGCFFACRYRSVPALGSSREETSRVCHPLSLCPDLDSPAWRTAQLPVAMTDHGSLRHTISNMVLCSIAANFWISGWNQYRFWSNSMEICEETNQREGFPNLLNLSCIFIW